MTEEIQGEDSQEQIDAELDGATENTQPDEQTAAETPPAPAQSAASSNDPSKRMAVQTIHVSS